MYAIRRHVSRMVDYIIIHVICPLAFLTLKRWGCCTRLTYLRAHQAVFTCCPMYMYSLPKTSTTVTTRVGGPVGWSSSLARVARCFHFTCKPGLASCTRAQLFNVAPRKAKISEVTRRTLLSISRVIIESGWAKDFQSATVHSW